MGIFYFIATPVSLESGKYLFDPLDKTREFAVQGASMKNALQNFVKSSFFDKCMQTWNTTWIYEKSHKDGKIYSIPLYDYIEI